MASKKDTTKKSGSAKKAAPKTKKTEKTTKVVSTIEATAETPVLPEVENTAIKADVKDSLGNSNEEQIEVTPIVEKKVEPKKVEEAKKEVPTEPLTKSDKIKVIADNKLTVNENVKKASNLKLIKNKITKYFGYTWNGQTIDD